MKQKLLSIFSLLSLFVLSACTDTAVAIANAPTAFFDGTIERNIVYDPATGQMLDIYTPILAAEEKLPVIVFFYGGRWTKGQKEDFAFVGTALAENGFVVVIPDHRKYPEVLFPDFVEDGAKAVNWVQNNISDHGGKADTLFLSGHSSGAHIASLLVVDERYLEPQTLQSIKGFAGLAGPYSFTPESEDLKIMFGPPSQYPDMQATTFIDGKEPPVLLLYGSDDKSVGLFNLERLEQEIRDNNGQVETIIYPDTGHVEIVGALSWILRSKAPVLEDMTTYFKNIAATSSTTE
ncbi:MAG: alpha/beta hydrolase [Proteobacteria bacterium]|nr:alpha/beta hydrolase [Pseudomonadota bacterium]